MDFLYRFFAIFTLSIKRLTAQRGMALAILVGVVTAAALAMSIPMYADAAYQRILQSEFRETFPGFSTGASTPPYAFVYRYVGAWFKPVQLQALQPVDAFLSGPVADDVTLPPQLFTRMIKTEELSLFSGQGGKYSGAKNSITNISVGSLLGIGAWVELQGRLPQMPADPRAPVEVLVSETLAADLHLKPGDLLTAYAELKRDNGTLAVEIPIVVTGVWKSKAPQDDFWFYRPTEFNSILITDEDSMAQRVLPRINNEVYDAVWYWVMDGSRVQSYRVPELLARINATLYNAEKLLPNIALNTSPVDVLTRFQRSANSLTLYLFAFSVPLLLMVLIFISLVVNMVAARQKNEIAVMRSRGASVFQVVGMTVLEGLLLGLAGLLLALPVTQVVVAFFSRAISFLNFSGSAVPLQDFNQNILTAGLAVIFVAVLAQMLPSISSAGHTIITYKQERARQFRRPWWQRAYLDVILLFPAGYGLYLLAQPGGLVLPGMKIPLPNDPFQNPFLLLIPALGAFAVSLFLLRILPGIMAAVSGLLARSDDVGILMAARYLARSAGGYSAPLVLLVMTLSLSTFTASLAQTLDFHLHDQTYYSIGADMSILDSGTYTGPQINLFAPRTAQQQAAQSGPPRWEFQPVRNYLKVSGVQGAARVGKASINLQRAGGGAAQYYGIDRAYFPAVVFWRSDFASQPLSEMMAALGTSENAVLVSRDFLAVRDLKVGDTFSASTRPITETFQLEFKIVGVFDLFPTWYPDKVPAVVGNLDYFFTKINGAMPYEVWLKLDPQADRKTLLAGLSAQSNTIINTQITSQQLTIELQRPERQGFFGLLSVGFTALSFLTVLGFLLYAIFSFRQRFIELGMLRAVGLSTRQMLTFLTSELAFLFIIGLGVGTGMGVGISNLFIPQLQVGNGIAARIPPFLVRIDWLSVFQIYILFALLFFSALAILGALLVRMKVFQAVKLGEAV